MAEVDISVWIGRPPPQRGDGNMHGAEESEEGRSMQNKTDSISPPPENVRLENLSMATTVRSRTQKRPDIQSPSHQIDSDNGFYIDVPQLSEKEEYEHLPGYFTVQRILREVRPGHYLVKLRSGEVDLVSMP